MQEKTTGGVPEKMFWVLSIWDRSLWSLPQNSLRLSLEFNVTYGCQEDSVLFSIWFFILSFVCPLSGLQDWH